MATEKLSPYVYEDINRVPKPWRTLKSAKLSLSQINEIMETAYAESIDTESGNVPNYGVARRKFMETHHIEEGFWVDGAEVTDESIT